MVGTEEGAIHAYSKEYNATLLRSFVGHDMAVYRVVWNPFHPDVFLSCSADWTVKMWHRGHSKPVLTFDMECAVGDVVETIDGAWVARLRAARSLRSPLPGWLLRGGGV